VAALAFEEQVELTGLVLAVGYVEEEVSPLLGEMLV